MVTSFGQLFAAHRYRLSVIAFVILAMLVVFTALDEKFGNQGSPSGLVIRSKTRSIVSVEVFVKQQMIFPIRIFLEFLGSAIHWPMS